MLHDDLCLLYDLTGGRVPNQLFSEYIGGKHVQFPSGPDISFLTCGNNKQIFSSGLCR